MGLFVAGELVIFRKNIHFPVESFLTALIYQLPVKIFNGVIKIYIHHTCMHKLIMVATMAH